ncbi:glycosyltransferase family 2 protein [Collinsella ihumii]|uniref:Glycosyltransferase family 2 protein n=1 Tax=Collinsella ihumii TaxID=1720204 RepID=A0ABT7XD15_9ACTN|nr:glycosyltransferase family 2 protein [Collinsella ihumii]MDN0063299.1 glycosyltransferase family 2 protein [Collinsella ihumii]
MPETVAILLATHNGERYIAEQLESIGRQTHRDWHLFVSDDGSSDGTLRVVEGFRSQNPDKVTIVSQGHRMGGAKENFFHLMRVVPRGFKAYCFCDQDDRWLPEKIEKTLAALEAIGSESGDCPCLAFCDARVVGADLGLIDSSFVSFTDVDPAATSLSELLVQNPISGAEVMVNERALELASRPSNLEGIDMHDQWLGLVVSAFGKMQYVDEALFEYRQHGDNEVGAKKMGLGSIISKARIAKSSLRKKEVQAARFVEEYRNILSRSQTLLLEGFASIEQLSKIARIEFLRKNGVRMNGLLRNAGLYAFV